METRTTTTGVTFINVDELEELQKPFEEEEILGSIKYVLWKSPLGQMAFPCLFISLYGTIRKRTSRVLFKSFMLTDKR